MSKRSFIGPAVVILIGLLSLAGLISLGIYPGKKSSGLTSSNPVFTQIQSSPGPTPTTTAVEITDQVRQLFEAAQIVESRNGTVSAASLSDASPQAASLFASGLAIMSGDALQLYVKYTGDAQAVADAVVKAGGRVEASTADRSILQVSIPLLKVEAVRSVRSVTGISLPAYGVNRQ